MVTTRVDEGGQPKNREDITVGHVEVPVKVYRTDGFPTIFAGFQINWIDGDDPATGASFSLCAGAGLGSKYMTLQVDVPGRPKVYEYVDVTELLQERVAAILAEARQAEEAEPGG